MADISILYQASLEGVYAALVAFLHQKTKLKHRVLCEALDPLLGGEDLLILAKRHAGEERHIYIISRDFQSELLAGLSPLVKQITLIGYEPSIAPKDTTYSLPTLRDLRSVKWADDASSTCAEMGDDLPAVPNQPAATITVVCHPTRGLAIQTRDHFWESAEEGIKGLNSMVGNLTKINEILGLLQDHTFDPDKNHDARAFCAGLEKQLTELNILKNKLIFSDLLQVDMKKTIDAGKKILNPPR